MKRIRLVLFFIVILSSFLLQGAVQASSLYFDGDGYVTLPNNISPAQITIEAWFNFTAPALDPSWNPIIVKETGTGAAEDFAWRLGIEGTDRPDRAPAGSIVFQVSNSSYTAFIHSTIIPNLNEWCHVAATYDGFTLRLYVNGIVEAQGADTYSSDPPWSGGNLNQASLPTGIGHLINWEIQYFRGYIDEACIWDTARTEEQIQNDKDCCVSGNESGLLAYWDFEPRVDPDILYDITSNHFDGTIYGGTWSSEYTHPIPYSITQITPDGIQASDPAINDQGEIVWLQYRPDYPEKDWEVFSNVRGQISDADGGSANEPEIGNNDEIVWVQQYSFHSHIFSNARGRISSDDGLQHSHPDVNINGEVIWVQNGDVYSNTRGYITSGLSNINASPSVNDLDEVVWLQSVDGVWQIFSNKRGQLTFEDANHSQPSINNNGELVWQQNYTAIEIISNFNGLITSGTGPNHIFPDINNRGEIVWEENFKVFKATPKKVPAADFNASPLTGDFPLTVYFTDQSTYFPTSWLWNFGDGETSTSQNPIHTYNSPDIYTISLAVSNPCGSDTEIKTDYINVTCPVPSIPSNPSPPDNATDVSFNADFDWADGNNTDSYDVYFGTSASPPFVGNVITSSYALPELSYSTLYYWQITANNDCGNSISGSVWSFTTEADPRPNAEFTGSPTSGTAPLEVQFTDQSTNNPASWNWQFGDGETSTSQNPSYTYSNSGSYSVSLSVTNFYGSDIETKTDFVMVSQPCPVASFYADPTSGNKPFAVSFYDQSTNDPTSWNWNFGDGDSSSEQNPPHTYNTIGTFSVSLTVSNSCGSAMEIKTDYITVYQVPESAFTATPLSGDAPLTVSFTDESTGTVTSWSWDFGDSGTSTDQNPTYTYNDPGSYTVILTVTGPGGSDTQTKPDYITVNGELSATIYGTVTDKETGEPISEAKVSAKCKGFGKKKTSTNASGYYEFTDLEDGVWKLDVKKKRYKKPVRATVEVSGGGTYEQDFELGR